jgi:sarcosine oxidase
VVGVGTMGSQVLHQLAVRGVPAKGFERFGIGHDRGAAGGESRIFRVAYKEGGQYVPLLRSARQAWDELSRLTGTRLLEPTGALTIGVEDDPDIRTITDVIDEWGLDAVRLDDVVAKRFPAHRLRDGDIAVLDRAGGLLRPTTAIRETVALARHAGAEVATGVQVEEVTENGHGVRVRYRRDGEVRTESFDQVVLCTGPWITRALPSWHARVEIRRAVLAWFRPTGERDFRPSAFPVGMRRSGGEHAFSFFPDLGSGVKINLHVPKSVVDEPDQLSAEVEQSYVDRMVAAVSACLDGVEPQPVAVRTYAEGYTPDNHGIIGRPPQLPSVLAMGGFSGHGFKLAPVLGAAATDLVLTGQTEYPIDHLALTRFDIA